MNQILFLSLKQLMWFFFNDCCFFSSVANSVGGEIFQLVLVTMALVKLWSFVWIRAPSLKIDLKIPTLASC